MSFVFAPPPQAVIPVEDEPYLFFPVNRIFGTANNYQEVGQTKTPEPFFFMKSLECLQPIALNDTLTVPMPPIGQDLRHEVELVCALGKGGRNLTLEQAAECVWGWSVGIDFSLVDMTLPNGGRDLMMGKSFKHAAPVSHLRPHYRTPLPKATELWLYVNNQKRQGGSTERLVWSPLEQIVRLSHFYELQPGDIIFTGTPGGVASLVPGDEVRCGVNGVGEIRVRIGEREA